MKIIFRSSVFLLGLIVLAATACSQSEPVNPPAPAPAPNAPAPDTTAATVEKMKAFTFEQRADFTTLVQGLVTQSDDAMAELNTGYNEMTVTPARRAAMVGLKQASADFKDKVHAIDNMTADTWETVRAAVVSSWQNLAGALAKAQAEKK